MASNTKLTLPDGIQITVPDSLNLITTYVLHEQGDWFEDEIKFVRSLLQPGQKVIDIGANYGVYTLTMAKLVGSTGHVVAFEPASMTARLLAESIASNNFTQVELEQAALSDNNGVATLSLNDNSELNSLVRDNKTTGMTETVPVTTLDDYMEMHELDEIAFLKLDAEGEEDNILRGGVRFFSAQSPLVQYEVKAGKEVHLELIHEFKELGYSSYRLIPGLNILVPFNEEGLVDGYLINLFCCKVDRATQLANQGYLIDEITIKRKEEVLSSCVNGKFEGTQSVNWLNELTKLPYGKYCAESWSKQMAARQCDEVGSALSCYYLSKNMTLKATDRFYALEICFESLKNLCETQPGYLRLASLGRVAREYGARSIAVKALSELCNNIFQKNKTDASEPFLAPGERFDTVSPENSIDKWIGAAALEELERNGAFSSFYTGVSARQRLSIIHNLGFGSDEMTRRLKLIELRFSRV